MPYNYWKRSPEDISGSVDQSQGFNIRYGKRYNDTNRPNLLELLKNKYKLYNSYRESQDEYQDFANRMPLRELLYYGDSTIHSNRNRQHVEDVSNILRQGYRFTPETEMSKYYGNREHKRIM